MTNKKISALTGATTPLAGTELIPVVQSSATVSATPAQITGSGNYVGKFSSLGVGISANDATGAKVATNGGFITYAGAIANAPTAASVVLDQQSGGVARLMASGASTWSATLAINPYGGQIVMGGTSPTGSEKFKVVGDTEFNTGNLIQGTAAKGINFTANTPLAGKTSQLLNWYEEGTFTPVISGDSGAGVGTYTTQTGYYTRIGRQVTVEIVLAWTAHTGVGNILVAGLPFTCNTGSQSAATIMAYNLSLTPLYYLIGRVRANSTLIDVLQSPTGGGAWIPVPIDTNVDALVVTVSYFV